MGRGHKIPPSLALQILRKAKTSTSNNPYVRLSKRWFVWGTRVSNPLASNEQLLRLLQDRGIVNESE